MDSKIEEAAKRVCSIQHEYDWQDHRTTGVIFMQTHGLKWLYERDRILNEIDVRRTEAIWSLDREMSAANSVNDVSTSRLTAPTLQ
jgi:hypothetical protein